MEITNILNDFLKKFDCTAALDSDFAYYSDDEMITYALVISDKHTKTFMDFAKTLFPTIEADPFIWSFLHELGHHETEDDFENEEWEEYMERLEYPITDDEYYHLPIEYAATYWAGEYMINHQEEIKTLWDELIPAIKDFYNKMGVDYVR